MNSKSTEWSTGLLIPSHRKIGDDETIFNWVYSKNHFQNSMHMDRAYVISLDKYKSKGTYWKAFYVTFAFYMTYFDNRKHF